MAKRSHEFEEYTRQTKKLVTDLMVKENDPGFMNQVYEKTNEALYDGSKRAFNGGGMASVKNEEMETDDNDVEMEDYFKNENVDADLEPVVCRPLKEPYENHPNSHSSLDNEIAQTSFAAFLDKGDVNRLRRLERRSPSPFPREPIPNFQICKCTVSYPGSKRASKQLCLRHSWRMAPAPTVSQEPEYPTNFRM